MMKRFFDIVTSLFSLFFLSPILFVAGVGIRLSSPGPILYRAKRAGLNGKPFIMHKFRTMHVQSSGDTGSSITAINDSRIFAFGTLLRKLKIDELPQLFDVLRGKMSIVGPRPEDLQIVEKYYTSKQKRSLSVKPGLSSPGSLYNYTHGHMFLSDIDPEKSYIEKLLPIKLDLELIYVKNKSFFYDVKIILRTVSTIILLSIGKKNFSDPPEISYSRTGKQ